jgi:hypothetical protein
MPSAPTAPGTVTEPIPIQQVAACPVAARPASVTVPFGLMVNVATAS